MMMPNYCLSMYTTTAANAWYQVQLTVIVNLTKNGGSTTASTTAEQMRELTMMSL